KSQVRGPETLNLKLETYVQVHLASSTATARRRCDQRHLWPLVWLFGKANWRNRGGYCGARFLDQPHCGLFVRLWRRCSMAQALRDNASDLQLDSRRSSQANFGLR